MDGGYDRTAQGCKVWIKGGLHAQFPFRIRVFTPPAYRDAFGGHQ